MQLADIGHAPIALTSKIHRASQRVSLIEGVSAGCTGAGAAVPGLPHGATHPGKSRFGVKQRAVGVGLQRGCCCKSCMQQDHKQAKKQPFEQIECRFHHKEMPQKAKAARR